MGKVIQCDCCNKIINPKLDSYSTLTGKDYNYASIGHVEHAAKIYFCEHCCRKILDDLDYSIQRIRKETRND